MISLRMTTLLWTITMSSRNKLSPSGWTFDSASCVLPGHLSRAVLAQPPRSSRSCPCKPLYNSIDRELADILILTPTKPQLHPQCISFCISPSSQTMVGQSPYKQACLALSGRLGTCICFVSLVGRYPETPPRPCLMHEDLPNPFDV